MYSTESQNVKEQIMQTTYRVKAGEIDLSLLNSIKSAFKEDQSLTITVKADSREDQYHMFLKSEELQKKYPPMVVDPTIDLSALANEVNL